MHYVGFVDPDDMNVVSGRRKFTSLVGYSGSKLAQVKRNLSFLWFLISEANGYIFYLLFISSGQVMF